MSIGWGGGTTAQAFEVLLERDVELAAVEAALGRAATGGGTLLIVEGAAGLGKTRLLRAAAELAADRRVVVGQTVGLELERDAPLGIVERLLAPLTESVAPMPIETTPGHTAFRFIRGLAESRHGEPLMLCVDDAHWADGASLRLFGQLAGHLNGLGIVLMLAMRPRDRETPLELGALRGQPLAEVLRVRPLSPDGVRALVSTVVPGAAQSFLNACLEVTGGNPFLLRQLLAELIDEHAVGDARTAARVRELVPDAVHQAVLTRIGRLSPAAAELASSLAVLGERTPLRLVAEHARLEVEEAEASAEELVAADVLAPDEPLRFRHPLIGSAVAADLGQFGRSRAHRRASAVLRAAGEAPERIAPHLLAMTPVGDQDTVAVLRAAADVATKRGDTALAMRLLSRALEEPPEAGARTDVLVDLALAGATATAPDAFERLQEALRLLPDDDPRRGRTIRALVKLLFDRGDYAAAAAAAEDGLQSLPDSDPVRDELLVDYMAVATFHPSARERLGELLDPLVAKAHRGQLPASPALCGRLATRAGIAGDVDLVKALAQRALGAESMADDPTHGLVFAFASASLTYVDELELAEQCLSRALERGRRLGSVAAQGIASQCRALVRVPMGNLAGAVADIDDALGLHAQHGGFFDGWCVPVLAHALIERGDLAEAERVLSRRPISEPTTMEDAFVFDICARLELERGNPARALSLLKTAGYWLAEQFGIDHPGVLAWRPRAAVAASRAGLDDEARELAQAALDEVRASAIARLRGVALAAAGTVRGGEAGIALLTDAVEQLEHSPALIERGHALVALGAVLRRNGRPADARAPLRRAVELAERCGARPMAQFATDELRATGARPRRTALSGVDSLTPSEHRIATLAAAGLSNAQIAAQLYLTPKTVEWHLGHVYAKLGVAARGELMRAMSADHHGRPRHDAPALSAPSGSGGRD